MNTITEVTQPEEASSLTNLLVALGKVLLKGPQNAEWLDVDQICHFCQKRDLRLDGRVPSTEEVETALKKLFGTTDELCIKGISITGFYRRVGGNQVLMVRFYPDVHSRPISFASMGADEPEPAENN